MLVSPEFFRHFSCNLRALPGSETGTDRVYWAKGHQEITADALHQEALESEKRLREHSQESLRECKEAGHGRTVTCRLHRLLGGT